MVWLNDVLLMLHFLGLAMGFSASFGNMVMMGIIAKAKPSEAMVLARFPPAISRVAEIGLALLWVTGVIMVFTRWGGPVSMPGFFWVKILAVVAMTGLVGYMHSLMGKARRGDMASARQLPTFGRIASICALLAVVFAVLAFQ